MSKIDFQGVRVHTLDHDFNFDPLGGIGRSGGTTTGGVGQVGDHTMQSEDAPLVRQSGRVPGPQKSIGRWFSKLLDKIASPSRRIQGRYERALEDYSAQAGKVMGRLVSLSEIAKTASEVPLEQMNALREDLTKLREEAHQLMRMGVSYKDLATARISRNIAILTNNGTIDPKELYSLKHENLLATLIDQFKGNDKLAGMAEDLQFVKNALDAIVNEQAAEIDNEVEQALPETVASLETHAEETPQATSRYSSQSIGEQVYKNLADTSAAREALANKQELLSQLTGDAKTHLEEALNAVESMMSKTVGMESGLDEKELNDVLTKVDQGMNNAITCAVDLVEQNALNLLGTAHVAGKVQQITAGYVDKEIASLREAQKHNVRAILPAPENDDKGVAQKADDNANEIQVAIRGTQKSIEDISELYGTLTTAINELKRKEEIRNLCLLLKDIADNGFARLPIDVTAQQIYDTCDKIIDALLTGTSDDATTRALCRLSSWKMNGFLSEDAWTKLGNAQELIDKCLSEASKPNKRGDLSGAIPASNALIRLHNREKLHKIIGDVGALLNQAKIPSADALTAQALKVSKSVLAKSDFAQIQAELSRLMSNIALATMQVQTPIIFSSQPYVTGLDQKAALKALGHLKVCMDELCASFPIDTPKALKKRTALAGMMKEAEQLNRAAQNVADAFAPYQPKFFSPNKVIRPNEISVAEQIAVVMESCNEDDDAKLLEMMEDSKWRDAKHGDKHATARDAIAQLLIVLKPFRDKYGKESIINHFNMYLNPGMKKKAAADQDAGTQKNDRPNPADGTNIFAHDIYLGFDNKIHVLINTNRQILSAQGAKWITLPTPEAVLSAGDSISTGTDRLDLVLNNDHNRNEFYPWFYSELMRYFNNEHVDLK